MSYKTYKTKMITDIKLNLDLLKSQPILFIGSGFSRRYFDAPNWIELLKGIKNYCPLLDKSFNYYSQKNNSEPIRIAEDFIDPFYEWAWGIGKDYFSTDIFEQSHKNDFYLKKITADYIQSFVPDNLEEITSEKLKNELKLLTKIAPHAIITTNYDNFLEKFLFEDYEIIIGQQILKTNYSTIGEILKIHGCSSEPSSLTLVDDDYQEFINKKKYLSSKLFTYFAEHPLLFIGYSANDPNIKLILSDIDELLCINEDIVPNIYIVTWQEDIIEDGYFEQIKTISLENGKQIKIKNIVTSDYDWVFETFSYRSKMENINIKTLRAFMARAHKMVRTDIPNNPININYETLDSAISSEEGIPKLLGITMLDGSTDFNACYPYSITDIANKLGYTHWSGANKLIDKIKTKHSLDIKSYDNSYHFTVKIGANAKSRTNKYSEKLFLLLEKVKNGDEDYIIDEI